MSDLEATLAGVWFVLIGIAWTFIVFMPFHRRILGRPRRADPVEEQLRMIVLIVICSALFVAILYGLFLLSPVVAIALPPFLFYGGLTLLLRYLERRSA